MKRNIFFLLSICLLLLTCSDSDDPVKEVEKPPIENKDPFITLKKTNIDFTNKGGSESITIESNVTWTTKSPASWCTVSPTSGSSSTTSITLSAPANEEYDTRSCTVTIESGNISKTITVNQGENLGLLISQDRYELGNEESTIKVEVKANVEFEVEINDEWITQVETRGLTTSELAFKIAENVKYGNREGSITIKQKGGNMSSTITIFQSQEDAIILSEKEFDLSSAAQSIEVEIKNNIDYEIIIPEDAKDWVSHSKTRALRTETAVLDIAENKDYDERSAKIIVKDKKTNLQETVTIKQASNTGLIVSEDKYELSNDGGTIEVEVKANVEFDIEIADSWITRVETRGLTATKLQFQVAKNESYDSREGTITIKQKGGNLSSTIKVYQSQKDAIIISEKTFDLSREKQAIQLELKTSVNFEVIIPEAAKSWVSYTPTRGLRTETLTLNISENKDYTARSTEVYVKNKKTSLQDTVTIKQAANLGFTVSKQKFDLNNEATTIEVDVKANFDFDVKISDSWITQVETRGLTSTKLIFSIAKNSSYDSREGTITIKQKDDELSSTIKVYQSQKDAIIISEKTFDLSNEKQAIHVELKTNVEFELIIPEAAKSWVSYTPTRGLRTETLTLNISENRDYTARSTELYVKNKKTNLQDTLTINQAANTGLIVSEDKYELTNDGGIIEVELQANVKFDIEISDKWITRLETRGLTATKLQFQVAKNENYDSREGSITIKQKGGNLSSTIKVYQSQKDAIILSDKLFDLSSEKQAIEVELKTNVEFEVIIPEAAKSWVSYTPTRGLRTETVTLNIAENESDENRYTDVFIKDKLTNLQETLAIYQYRKPSISAPDEPDYTDLLETSYESAILYFDQISVLDASMCNSADNNRGISPHDRVLQNAFAKGYQAIHPLNFMIEEIDNTSYIEAKPFTYTSKVLRAMIYLDMVQHWGDMPFITRQLSLDEIYVSRTDKVEIYNALLEDLKEASDKELFIPQDLVNALIGIIHLELKNYSAAASSFEKTVEKSSMVFMNNNVGLLTHNPSLNIEDIAPLYNKRYMQLNYAEALLGANQPSELLIALNTIRKEGNMELLQELPNEPEYEIANLWKELIGVEYGYFALLKRLGIAVELLDIREYQQLYPIPQRELDLNPYMTQNPWY